MEHLKGALLGFAPALIASVRLGWKALPWTVMLVNKTRENYILSLFFLVDISYIKKTIVL